MIFLYSWEIVPRKYILLLCQLYELFPNRVSFGQCPDDICKSKVRLLSHTVSSTSWTRGRFAHESLQFLSSPKQPILPNWTLIFLINLFHFVLKSYLAVSSIFVPRQYSPFLWFLFSLQILALFSKFIELIFTFYSLLKFSSLWVTLMPQFTIFSNWSVRGHFKTLWCFVYKG